MASHSSIIHPSIQLLAFLCEAIMKTLIKLRGRPVVDIYIMDYKKVHLLDAAPLINPVALRKAKTASPSATGLKQCSLQDFSEQK